MRGAQKLNTTIFLLIFGWTVCWTTSLFYYNLWHMLCGTVCPKLPHTAPKSSRIYLTAFSSVLCIWLRNSKKKCLFRETNILKTQKFTCKSLCRKESSDWAWKYHIENRPWKKPSTRKGFIGHRARREYFDRNKINQSVVCLDNCFGYNWQRW